MHLIDLHCDTLYKATTENIPIDDASMELQINNSEEYHRLQCFAIWLPDELNSDDAEKLFFNASKKLKSECERCGIKLLSDFKNLDSEFNHNKNLAVLTVENGSALNGKIENVRIFSELGVKMLTLTWNGKNEIGDGAGVDNAIGITSFGKSVIREMEEHNIIIDISHASDKLFYDVAELTTRPFVASHSNTRSITPHERNLTDEQIKIIIDRKGLFGLNFHNKFLNENYEQACIYDILRHTEHFLSLGGENCISFGTDFDGCTLPCDIKGSQSIDNIYEMFLKHNYNESLIRKIFYENALIFFENFDNQRIM